MITNLSRHEIAVQNFKRYFWLWMVSFFFLQVQKPTFNGSFTICLCFQELKL